MIFALAAPAIVGACGLAVETGYWFFRDRQLQAAADAAAYAGAIENRAGKPLAVMKAAALNSAERNGFDGATGTIVVASAPKAGPFAGNVRAVEVTLARPEQRFFTAIFSTSVVKTGARSVATFLDAGQACIVALDPSASGAANFTGSSSLTLNGCTVLANSTSSAAIEVQGAAALQTPCIIAVGGVDVDSGLDLTDCDAPIVDAPPLADPFRDLVEPSSSCTGGGGGVNVGSKKKEKLDAKGGTLVLCGGVDVHGDLELGAGTYVIHGGDFRVNSGGVVTGTGVTLVFKNDADLRLNGGSTVNLTAPSTGAMAGILMFGGRSNTGDVQLNGGASSALTGAIYFPNQEIETNGNFAGVNGCTQIVGKIVSWSGNSSLSVNCPPGFRSIPAQQFVRLVE